MRASLIFGLCLTYLIIFIACIRSGALLVDMHDDAAFVVGLCCYFILFPVTLLFGSLFRRLINH